MEPVALAATAAQLTVLLPRVAHRVSLDGSHESVPFPKPMKALVGAPAEGMFGVLMADSVTSPSHFCLFDALGSFAASECSAFSTGNVRDTPVVGYVDGSFRAYQANEQGIQRWTFGGENGTSVVGDEILTTQDLGFFLATAADTAAGEAFITMGVHETGAGECRTLYLYNKAETDAQYRRLNLLEPNQLHAWFPGEISVSSTGRAAIVNRAQCAPERCGQVTDEQLAPTLLTVIDPEGAVTTRVLPFPRARHGTPATFFDGASLVLVYSVDGAPVLTRLRPDGQVDLAEIPLPIGATGQEYAGTHLGLALAPDDYVIVYTQRGQAGIEAQAARITLH